MRTPVGFNPFVGLRSFERGDSLFYFGRAEQVQSLLELLTRERFLAVVGSSGCGKSSLVRAGLIPALEGGFLVQDRDRWRIAAMKPGEAPLRHLALALIELGGSPASRDAAQERLQVDGLTARLYEEGVDAALELLEAADAEGEANVLLLVDQLEELFRYALSGGDARSRDRAEAFVSLLLGLARQQRLPVYVCMSMRSDFLGDCDAFIGLPEAINAGQFLVPRLTREQRRQAIEGPIRLAGGEIASRLVDRLLNEGLDTRDDLPILQHLLMRIWDARAASADGPIDLGHYEQVHTIHRALDRHAEEALEELSPADRLLARCLFQSLTELDSGNRRIRRPVHLSEVAAISEVAPERVMDVIDCFRSGGRSFLVLSSEDAADDPLIDISHESLIRQWRTLCGWVDEEAAAAKLYRRLTETAAVHPEGKADLYRGADLEQALAWKRRDRPNLAWARRYPGDFPQAMAFLRQSRLARCEEARDKKHARMWRERLLREKADLAERQAEQERAARKQARRWTLGMALLAMLMLAAAGVALLGWHEADYQKAQAQAASERAETAVEQAQAATEQARTQLLAANFNLAKAHEEKAVGILNEPEARRGTRDYQRALLHALQAQRQRIGGKPALQLPGRSRLAAGRWSGPSRSAGLRRV
jgi:hypothetical protein